MSDFGTMIDRIAAELERSDLGSSSSPGVIGTHINDAIRQHKARNWWFLQGPTSAALTSTTTASNSYVSEYSGLVQLDSLRITVNSQLNQLDPISFEEMELLHDGNPETGEPFKFSRWGGRVQLYPTPDDVYTLTWSGLFEEAALSVSADTNDWMTHGELVIRHTARMTILRDYLRDMEGAQLCIPGIEMAIVALDREHMRRSVTRNIRPRM
jgi:hypothetical protein